MSDEFFFDGDKAIHQGMVWYRNRFKILQFCGDWYLFREVWGTLYYQKKPSFQACLSAMDTLANVSCI